MDDFARFAKCLQFKLLAFLGSVKHKGVKVEVSSLESIQFLVYFSKEAREAESARWLTEIFLRENGF